MNSDILAKMRALLERLHQSHDIEFSVVGKDMIARAFDIMVILRNELWSLRLRISRGGGTHSSTSLVLASTCTHNFFVVLQNIFNVPLCPRHIASIELVNQYQGQHMSRAHITCSLRCFTTSVSCQTAPCQCYHIVNLVYLFPIMGRLQCLLQSCGIHMQS